MEYQVDQIYLIQLNFKQISRFLIKVISKDNHLYLLPFNIQDQEPLPISVLNDFKPLLIGYTLNDHYAIQKLIAEHYPVINTLLWHSLQRKYKKRGLGKLFNICQN